MSAKKDDASNREYRRLAPRTVTARTVDGAEKSGKDLADVVRDLVYQALEDIGVSQSQAAGPFFAVSQSTLNRQLRGESDVGLDLLSRLCIMLDEPPDALFQSHPEYSSRAGTVYPKDHLYRKYNSLLRVAEARGLLSLLQEGRSLRVFDQCIDAVRTTVEAGRAARRPTTGRKAPARQRAGGGRKKSSR